MTVRAGKPPKRHIGEVIRAYVAARQRQQQRQYLGKAWPILRWVAALAAFLLVDSWVIRLVGPRASSVALLVAWVVASVLLVGVYRNWHRDHPDGDTDAFLNQRSTLVGYAILFGCTYLVGALVIYAQRGG